MVVFGVEAGYVAKTSTPRESEKQMRRSAAGAALIAAVGFSALSAAPASADVHGPIFPVCDAAFAAGIYNIPQGSPAYTSALDSDADGIGCESDTYAYDAAKVAEIVEQREWARNNLPPNTGIIAGPDGTGLEEAPQIEQVPLGGADTGVAVEPAEGNGAAAVAGGLALAVAGGALLARRRTRTA